MIVFSYFELILVDVWLLLANFHACFEPFRAFSTRFDLESSPSAAVSACFLGPSCRHRLSRGPRRRPESESCWVAEARQFNALETVTEAAEVLSRHSTATDFFKEPRLYEAPRKRALPHLAALMRGFLVGFLKVR